MSDAIITTAGLRIVKLLVGRPPQTIASLLPAVGVTRTAVTEQLNDLVAAGFVERQAQRLPSRGRPRFLYRATDAALVLLFADKQRLLVPAIWQAIDELAGSEMVKKIVKRVGRAMADHYGGKITAKRPQERLRQFVRLLEAEGAMVGVVEGDHGQLLLEKRSCSFLNMVDPRRNICRIDQELIGAVIGRPVRQHCCRHDGAPSCTFEIVN
jgi:predicted ArsR family transcriptional regulator